MDLHRCADMVYVGDMLDVWGLTRGVGLGWVELVVLSCEKGASPMLLTTESDRVCPLYKKEVR